MQREKNAPAAIGRIERADAGNGHQLQLWIERRSGGWLYLVRSAYMPGGKPIRSCVLDSGQVSNDYQAVVKEGRAALERQTQ